MTLRRPTTLAPQGLFLLIALTIGMPAWAVSAGEAEELTRLADELKALSTQARNAQRRADHGGRRRFNYAWLRQDLARVRLGIEEYLTPGRSEPRSFAPVRGQYLR